jgi:hypothetical protein
VAFTGTVMRGHANQCHPVMRTSHCAQVIRAPYPPRPQVLALPSSGRVMRCDGADAACSAQTFTPCSALCCLLPLLSHLQKLSSNASCT